uniref:Neurotransmitter-gated ion-channel ligand-binding domain-containing protein n=1 Tax=Panagrolaimus sp. JU765 TaxID=591449 RepID=A0AC34RI39_9BILA
MWGKILILSFFLFWTNADISLKDFNPSIPEEPEEIINKTYVEEQSTLQLFIFKNYNRKIKPTRNQSLPITVKAHIYVMHFSLDESEQTLLLNGHIFLTWYDELAVWDPAQFNNLRFTIARQWELWQPDLRVANSVAGANQVFEISRRSHASLESVTPTSTKVQMYPTFLIKIGCHFDYSNYPYDEQSCALRLYPLSRMNDVILEVYYDLSPSVLLGWGDEAENKHIGEWRLVETSSNVTYFRRRKFQSERPANASEAARTWSILMVGFVLRRASSMYWVTMGLPAITSSVFNIISFLAAKPEHGLMITIGNLFIQVIFLQDFLKQLPPAVGKAPPIVVFTDGLLIMTIIAMVIHLINKRLVVQKAVLPQKYVLLFSKIRNKIFYQNQF